jgi:hypothetical protein
MVNKNLQRHKDVGKDTVDINELIELTTEICSEMGIEMVENDGSKLLEGVTAEELFGVEQQEAYLK